MATATAVAPARSEVLPKINAVLGDGGLLDRNCVERKEERELLAMAVLAQEDLLLLGGAGVGKSYMLDIFTEHGLDKCKLFNHMIFKESGVEELLGPRSVKGIQNDEVRRIIDGMLPTADTAVLDEIFKGSAAVLNAMLDLFAKRVLKIGGQVIDCSNLKVIMMASNELPDREDLGPFRDRITMTKWVESVKTPEGRTRVAKIQIARIKGETTKLVGETEPLTDAVLTQAREETAAIAIPDQIIEMVCGASGAQQKWLEAGHEPSQRRMEGMWKVFQAHAYLADRSTVSAADLLPAQHMAWNLPDHADSARNIITQFAGEFIRRAQRERQALEPLLKELGSLKPRIASAKTDEEHNAVIEDGVKLTGQFKRLAAKADKTADEGRQQGQDVSEIEALSTEADEAAKWVHHALEELEGI